MNSAVSEPALIGVDWGTSSLRAFLIAADGEVIDSVASSEGIMQIDGHAFEEVLDRLIAPWVASTDLPVMASGMITSRNGWVETPYAEMPLSAGDLARSLVLHKAANGTRIHFVTGASTEDTGGPDVMRGEETQIIGASSLGLSGGTFVMPGTHSKWVQVAEGEIKDFSTYMTGEVFAALKGHTILGTLMKDNAFSKEAFVMGVKAGLEGQSNLLHGLFHVRTLPLMGKIPDAAAADYMSGLLIGTEVAAATADAEGLGPITIVGRSDLSERYEIALNTAGYESRHAPDDIVAKGHFHIARAAGVVG
ncbi:2-oxo-3-deoxygalactonate kinase [Roseobacter sp. SK209-2-6]|uniref:2-dehydro-3-deoxygalactonokinase n=1 Tax=Roseobacter sp. SK209-2-6 TaxID=388739 RepID=UPI0000F3C563|nr:2-dehydro-3-deoxygalactonokinase [Roseobacter sp. SK209-2-6]EBA18618.1 2-oxo-3-deoxygalactonate kinase [Roseobacter sp. SK209-2-6]